MSLRIPFPLLALALSPLLFNAHADPLEAILLPESVVEYEIRDNTSVIVGGAPLTTLELRFDDADLRDTRLVATLDPARFSTGNILRDTNARRTVFEVDEFPLIRFEVSAVEAGAGDLPTGATRILLLRGRLDLHGIERELEVPLTVTRSGDRLSASGEFAVLLSDHDMLQPRFLFVVVEDRVVVRLRIEAELLPAGE